MSITAVRPVKVSVPPKPKQTKAQLDWALKRGAADFIAGKTPHDFPPEFKRPAGNSPLYDSWILGWKAAKALADAEERSLVKVFG